MLKTADLRAMGIDELLEKESQFKKELMQHRFQSKTGKLETQSKLGATRRDIARILTVINEKKREDEAKGKAGGQA